MKKTVGELLNSFVEIEGFDEFYWWQAYRQMMPPDDPWTIAQWQVHTNFAANGHEVKWEKCLPTFATEEQSRAAQIKKQNHQAMMVAKAQELKAKRKAAQLHNAKR